MSDGFSSLSDIIYEIKDSLVKSFSKGTRDDFGYEIVDGQYQSIIASGIFSGVKTDSLYLLTQNGLMMVCSL